MEVRDVVERENEKFELNTTYINVDNQNENSTFFSMKEFIKASPLSTNNTSSSIS